MRSHPSSFTKVANTCPACACAIGTPRLARRRRVSPPRLVRSDDRRDWHLLQCGPGISIRVHQPISNIRGFERWLGNHGTSCSFADWFYEMNQSSELKNKIFSECRENHDRLECARCSKAQLGWGHLTAGPTWAGLLESLFGFCSALSLRAAAPPSPYAGRYAVIRARKLRVCLFKLSEYLFDYFKKKKEYLFEHGKL